MKIAIDLTPLYGRKRTGVEMYAIDLYRALLSTGHCIIPIFHQLNELDDNKNAYVISKSMRLWLENLALSRAIRVIKADVAIFPIFPPPVDLYLWNHCKIYQTVHDTAFLRYNSTLNFAARYYYMPKQKLALKYADGIITISETAKSQLLEYTKLPVLNLGENIASEYLHANEKADVAILEKWNLKPESYYISVSTIEPRKNFEYLLQVITPLLKKQHRKLVLVGRRGWGKNENLQKLINIASENLVFTDYVSMEELFSLYKYSYAFSLLSKDEGFGRTPFEAVACGCKRVILSDIEIFRETFDGNALFLPLDSVEKSTFILNNDQLPCVKADFDLPFNVIEKKLKNEFLSVIRNCKS